MADTKPKKSAPKLFDISRPGKSAPSATSRPVIITNRPVLKDPMVIRVNSDADNDDNASNEPSNDTAEMKHKVDIQPLHIDLSEVLPSSEKAKADDETAAEDVPENAPERKIAEVPVAAEAEKDDVLETSRETKPEANAAPEPEKNSKPAADPDSSKTPVQAEETPEETPVEPVSEEEAALEAPADTEPAIDEDGSPVLSERDAKAADVAKKKAEEQEKIIASGEYYLPINAASKRRTKRNLVISSLLFVVLVALAAAAAWDAGLFSISGMQPPTNFL